MAVKKETSIHRYIGDTADTKPTSVPVGSTYLDRQTGILYITYDGTNYVVKSSGDTRPATPTSYNLTLTNANTEYSQALPANCRGFSMQPRSAVDVRFAFVTGKVATPTAPWATMKDGAPYTSPDINQGAAPSTIYLASATAGTIVEIVAWT